MQLLSRSAPSGLARPALRGSRAVALPTRRVVAHAKTPKVDTEELKAKAVEIGETSVAFIKDKWEKTEDKPAAVLVTGAGIIALSLGLSVVNIVDKIPLISDLIELVGIGVTGWFIYRYLTVGPDRDELFVTVKDFISKIYK